MLEKTLNIGSTIALPKPELDALLADLRSNGYQTVGPRVQDESIVYEEIEGPAGSATRHHQRTETRHLSPDPDQQRTLLRFHPRRNPGSSTCSHHVIAFSPQGKTALENP